MKNPILWPSPSSIPALSDHQRSTLAQSFSSRIGVLAGTPGTGKTYTAAHAIKAIISEHGPGQTAICAPTGKAAVRCTSFLQSPEIGLTTEATTIHRLLGVNRLGYDGKGWGFNYNAHNRLPYRFYLLDESSMLDSDTGASFFQALPRDAHLLLIGDCYQLPPVGHGAVLRDLIAAGVPCGELSEIRRNSGDIVRVCRDIKDGESFRPSPGANISQGHNLCHIESRSAAQTLRNLRDRLLSASSNGIDPIWDIQVIVAVNEKSELSRKSINKGMQGLLNPNGEQVKGNPFRVGDKVICTSNTILHVLDEQGNKIPAMRDWQSNGSGESEEKWEGDFVANGEIGRVVRVDQKLMHVAFDLPKRCVEVPLGKGGGDGESGGSGVQFDLAYAVTCHKMQGSSAKIVIVLVDDYPGANFVCSREWHYTAWSRAEELCLTIGRIETVNKQCRKVVLGTRKTFLKERIQEQLKAS